MVCVGALSWLTTSSLAISVVSVCALADVDGGAVTNAATEQVKKNMARDFIAVHMRGSVVRDAHTMGVFD